ncbi:MAG: hypothetical protein CBC35_00380 [Planctomycetes bacterium TMED75]|nr:hypothetical protein [Planctomycetaceae bacterium]OUU96907.1 MAG: hypothetical protein CBC35_00380 [Planctomycetes bacterium TMED75]
MKNAGLAGAIALCGIGLMMIGLGHFVKAPRAMAYTPAVAGAVQDEGEPTIVWYGTSDVGHPDTTVLLRAWSDGTVEARWVRVLPDSSTCWSILGPCFDTWVVVSSPTEGLNAAADITFDEVVDAQDLAELLARWGDAPRNPLPPRDCPVGLLN